MLINGRIKQLRQAESKRRRQNGLLGNRKFRAKRKRKTAAKIIKGDKHEQ